MIYLRLVDHLLFGVDPKSLSTESQHEVIPYLRAWRPTYIYVRTLPKGIADSAGGVLLHPCRSHHSLC